MTPEDRQALDRRRSRRNWALLLVLVGMVVLFYFISMAKLTQG